VTAANAVLKSEWAVYGLARYLSAKLMWDASADVEALKQDFCRKMFPNATTEFERFMSLYESYGGNIQIFLRQGFSCLDKVRQKLRTAEERKRWEFYALYLHYLTLEQELYGIKYGRNGFQKGTSYDLLKLNRQLVSFIRAIEDRGIVESSQRIGVYFLPRLTKLKWAKFSGPNAPKLAEPDATDEAPEEDAERELEPDESEEQKGKPDPFDKTLTWHQKRQAILKDIPELELDAKKIDQLFDQDLSQFE